MKINFFATLRQKVGRKTIELPIAGDITLRQAIEQLVARYPQMESELLDSAGGLNDHIHVFINGHDLNILPEGLDTRVTPDSKVDIFPPIAGG